jgi:glycosyltransferase involved in cell wall biosynthesis
MKEISNEVGIAVEHGNVEDLIRAIERIQSDKELYRRLSKNALEKSKAFSWEKISERFNQIYYSLANLNNTKTDFE